MSKETVKNVTNCRACGSDKLEKYLNLGLMPLANNLCVGKYKAVNADRFPLEVLKCNDCTLSQLSIVISPEILFSNYTYRSSVNKGYTEHCAKMANLLKRKYNLNEFSTVLDIAGNDGALLREFKKEIGCNTINIEPAKNLSKISEDSGIETINLFWGKDIDDVRLKLADIIIATNVFAHVDDCSGFLAGCRKWLKSDGHIILEFPYVGELINNNEFDTIYFEHLSYFSIAPLEILCKKNRLRIIYVEDYPIHGGTLRVTIKHDIVQNRIEWENQINYSSYSENINHIIKEFIDNIRSIKNSGGKIAGFAASAKGNTLLNACKIGNGIIDYIVDETPEKIGKFSPGAGIPIVGMDIFNISTPDYIVILSWNFKDEIIAKLNTVYKGKYIIPIPKWQIV